MKTTEVLIAGAGPTGLVLALWLVKSGIQVRIIDKAEVAGTTSRALVVHARNLEFYRQLGIADEVIHQGLRFESIYLWVKGERAAVVPLGDLGKGLSKYPYVLILPQDQHEKILEAELQKHGISIERNTELSFFEEKDGEITAKIRHASDAIEEVHCSFLAGCDGAHSLVRHMLDIHFEGKTYDYTFYVADLKGNGKVADGNMHVALDDSDFLAVFPMQGKGNIRLVGGLESHGDEEKSYTWEDVSTHILKRLEIGVETVNWFSSYRIHHRLAASFRKGNVFLLGDAGHIHSPVGGQGMNTGIGDAVNLAWKLADVLRKKISREVLDTYEPERMSFAKMLVSTTDRAFNFVSKKGFLAKEVRTIAAPLLLPRLLRSAKIRHLMFRTISQIRIAYKDSLLSQGHHGNLAAGERLPWVEITGGDIFELLSHRNWLAYAFSEMSLEANAVLFKHQVKTVVLDWTEKLSESGFSQGFIYLVRPDGYLAWIGDDREAGALHQYLERFQISGGNTDAKS